MKSGAGKGANRKPKLKRNKVRLVPYRTRKTLEVLGRSKCELKAGAEVR